MPGVAHREAQRRRGRSRSSTRLTVTRHLAAFGELDGVAEQVGEHLAQAPGIAAQRRGHVGLDERRELEALALRRAAPAGRRCPPRCARRSKSRVSSSSLPASILEKSRMSLMIVSSASALFCTVCA